MSAGSSCAETRSLLPRPNDSLVVFTDVVLAAGASLEGAVRKTASEGVRCRPS